MVTLTIKTPDGKFSVWDENKKELTMDNVPVDELIEYYKDRFGDKLGTMMTRIVTEALYGKDEDYEKILQSLHEDGIIETCVKFGLSVNLMN